MNRVKSVTYRGDRQGPLEMARISLPLVRPGILIQHDRQCSITSWDLGLSPTSSVQDQLGAVQVTECSTSR